MPKINHQPVIAILILQAGERSRKGVGQGIAHLREMVEAKLTMFSAIETLQRMRREQPPSRKQLVEQPLLLT